jgi:hypothetical protein
MGDLFKSDNEQQTAQKGYTRSVFEDPNSKKLIDQLSGQFSNPYQTDDASKNVQNAGIQSMLAGLGKGAQTVDTTGALNAIRAASDAQTPKDIASVRSQMYNKPQGRNEIAVADTVSRNNATRDAALYNTEMAGQQFNAQQQNSATQNQNQLAQVLSQYMNPSQTGQANNNAQALVKTLLVRISPLVLRLRLSGQPFYRLLEVRLVALLWQLCAGLRAKSLERSPENGSSSASGWCFTLLNGLLNFTLLKVRSLQLTLRISRSLKHSFASG